MQKSETMSYDSKADTLEHIKRVNHFLTLMVEQLLKRARVHDDSKLKEPEKSEFDKLTPLLKTLTYSSEEYKDLLKQLNVALKHHYENNTHHPEHYENGIDGMNLIDILEMFADWLASTKRMKNGDILKSIDVSKTRFNMSDKLANIFRNTIDIIN